MESYKSVTDETSPNVNIIIIIGSLYQCGIDNLCKAFCNHIPHRLDLDGRKNEHSMQRAAMYITALALPMLGLQ